MLKCISIPTNLDNKNHWTPPEDSNPVKGDYFHSIDGFTLYTTREPLKSEISDLNVSEGDFDLSRLPRGVTPYPQSKEDHCSHSSLSALPRILHTAMHRHLGPPRSLTLTCYFLKVRHWDAAKFTHFGVCDYSNQVGP